MGKRPLHTDEYEISAGWDMEVLTLGADSNINCTAKSVELRAIRTSVAKAFGALLMFLFVCLFFVLIFPTEAVMTEGLPLGAGSNLQVYSQWWWYQCLMHRHLCSGHKLMCAV